MKIRKQNHCAWPKYIGDKLNRCAWSNHSECRSLRETQTRSEGWHLQDRRPQRTTGGRHGARQDGRAARRASGKTGERLGHESDGNERPGGRRRAQHVPARPIPQREIAAGRPAAIDEDHEKRRPPMKIDLRIPSRRHQGRQRSGHVSLELAIASSRPVTRSGGSLGRLRRRIDRPVWRRHHRLTDMEQQ